MIKGKAEICKSDAILFAAPLPKKSNPYAKGLYPDASLACCTFDALDCILSQSGEQKSQFDLVRKIFHNKVQELGRSGGKISEIVSYLNSSQACLKQPIADIEKYLIQHASSSEQLIQAVAAFYKKSHPIINFLEFRQLLMDFVQNLHYLPLLVRSASEALVSEYKLNKDEILPYAQEVKHLANKASDDAMCMYNFTQKKLLESSGFKPDKVWVPSMSIDNFIAVLKNRGLLLMMGAFQKDYYSKDPVLKSIGSHQFLAYEKGAFTVPKGLSITHSIVVIGASKKGYARTIQNYVYYIDPAKDVAASSYPVYMMSYENFRTRLVKGLTGVKVALESDAQDYGYSYYHPQFTPAITPSACSYFWQRHRCKIAALTVVTAVAATVCNMTL